MQSLSDKVYTILETVPKGRVTTYKAIGIRLQTKAYRAIGQILRNNPYAPRVPCHRVVKSDGSIGGFNGAVKGKNIVRKVAILKKEGVQVINGYIVNFDKIFYSFS